MFSEQGQSCEPTSEEKAPSLSPGRPDFDLKQGHRRRGEALRDSECLLIRNSSRVPLGQLLSAAEPGNLDLITALVEDGNVNVNSADYDRYTSLLFASENGQGDAVRLLIRMGSEVNAKNAAGESCIWLASRYGHEAVVRILLENGADLDSADELEQTAISAAAKGGHLRVVEILLERGSDIRTPTSYGKMADMFAANGGHDAVVHALLAHDTKNSSQMPVDLYETSLTMTREDVLEGAFCIVGSNSGGNSPGLG